jgi:3-dehydrosphinganine reductase
LPAFAADQLPNKKGDRSDAEWMMDVNYFSALYTLQAILKLCTGDVSDDKTVNAESLEVQEYACGIKDVSYLPERIVITGSVLSMITFIGFSSYAASKYALRALADTLRNEFVAFGTRVHFCMPGNMDTPGFELENLKKPKITAQIEGASSTVTAKQAAEFVLAGICNGRYAITNDVLGELARISTNGAAPRPNLVAEVVCVTRL